jgi:hypothetical protein
VPPDDLVRIVHKALRTTPLRSEDIRRSSIVDRRVITALGIIDERYG